MKLSSNQLFWLLFSMEVGMTSLLTLTPSFKLAKQAIWLSILVAALISVFITSIASKLSLKYPNQTLIQFAPSIAGKWLGTIISISYLVIWYIIAGMILRQYADFVHMALFTSTPMWVIILFMLLAIVYAVQGGIHILGRCGEVLGPFIMLSIFLFFALTVHHTNPHRLLPPLPQSNVFPVLKDSLGVATFLSESVMVMMLIAFLAEKKSKITAAILWGVIVSSLFIMVAAMSVTMVMGTVIPSKLQYPIYNLLQYLSVMEFIQNIDVLAVIVNIFSIFIKLGLYLFITSYGTAQILHIKKWRFTLMGSAPLIYLLAILPRNVVQSQVIFPEIWKIVFPIHLIGIPLLLYVISLMQRNRAGERA